MLLKGTIYATVNPHMVMSTLKRRDPRMRVITITEEIQFPNCIDGIILMPPSNAIRENLNGNSMGFKQIYRNYLYSPGPSEFISAVLKALIKGKNILLYLTVDEYKSGFFNVLFDRFKEIGIFIGTSKRKFLFDPKKIPIILDLLYMTGYINVKELMAFMPPKVWFSKNELQKLLYEFPLPCDTQDENSVALAYFTYKENVKRNNNKYLTPLFVRGDN